MLVATRTGFVAPTIAQRKSLVLAFAEADFIVYGKAFDLIKTRSPVNLDDAAEIRERLKEIVLYEVKSTSKPTVRRDFRGYFFSLSTAELLVAQNLGPQLRFAFVNTLTGSSSEFDLREIFARARGIYPSWSIQF